MLRSVLQWFFLEREVIGSKGLKQNDGTSTRAVKIARRTLEWPYAQINSRSRWFRCANRCSISGQQARRRRITRVSITFLLSTRGDSHSIPRLSLSFLSHSFAFRYNSMFLYRGTNTLKRTFTYEWVSRYLSSTTLSEIFYYHLYLTSIIYIILFVICSM